MAARNAPPAAPVRLRKPTSIAGYDKLSQMFAEAMHNIRSRQLRANAAKAEIDRKLDKDNAKDLAFMKRLGELLRRYSLADRDMVFGDKASAELTGAKLTIYTDHEGTFTIVDEDALVRQLLADDDLKHLVSTEVQTVYSYDKPALKALLKAQPELLQRLSGVVALAFNHKFKVEVPLSPSEKRAEVKPSPWATELNDDEVAR